MGMRLEKRVRVQWTPIISAGLNSIVVKVSHYADLFGSCDRVSDELVCLVSVFVAMCCNIN